MLSETQVNLIVTAEQAGKVKPGLRPEDIPVASNTEVGENQIVGEIFLAAPLGWDDMRDVVIGETHLYVLVSPDLRLRAGDRVSLKFDTNASPFFDPDTEQSLLWN